MVFPVRERDHIAESTASGRSVGAEAPRYEVAAYAALARSAKIGVSTRERAPVGEMGNRFVSSRRVVKRMPGMV